MMNEVKSKPTNAESLRSIGLKVMAGTQSGQDLIRISENEDEIVGHLELVFNELANRCWDELSKNRELRSKSLLLREELALKVKETQNCLEEITSMEEKFIREVEIIQSRKTGVQTCDQSIVSEQEVEEESPQFASNRSSVKKSKKKINDFSIESVKRLDKLMADTQTTLAATKEFVKECSVKEFCLELRVKALESKYNNLVRLEELHSEDLSRLREEHSKAQFYFLRKAKNRQVIQEHTHEVKVASFHARIVLIFTMQE